MMAQLDELRSQIRSRSQQRVLLLLFRVAHKQEPLGTEGYLAHHGLLLVSSDGSTGPRISSRASPSA